MANAMAGRLAMVAAMSFAKSGVSRSTAQLPLSVLCSSNTQCFRTDWALFQTRNLFGSSSGKQPTEEDYKNAERMLDVMSNSPSMRQMMLAMMPPGMRNDPDVITKMLSNPTTKQMIAKVMVEKGIKMPNFIRPDIIEHSVSQLQKRGVDVTQLAESLRSHPDLLLKLQQPQYMQAFLETTDDPSAATKFSPETMEVVRKVQDVLRQKTIKQAPASDVKDAVFISSTQPVQQAAVDSNSSSQSKADSSPTIQLGPPPETSTTTAALTGGTSSSASQQATASQSSETTESSTQTSTQTTAASTASKSEVPFMSQILEHDPSLADKLQNPTVQKALAEISKSPWKTIKWVFNRDVMDVFKALNQIMINKRKT